MLWLWCLLAGKTAAFLVPALCQLDYPPELFPEDLEGPQLLLLVPSFELGVQACMLLYKLWGGNISSRTPGDPANMFSYTGPPGIKVSGTPARVSTPGRRVQGVCGSGGKVMQTCWAKFFTTLVAADLKMDLQLADSRARGQPKASRGACML